VDLTAASAQPESGDDVATVLDRTKPRLEVAWRASDVDPLVPDVLDRQDVVVVANPLEPDDAPDAAPGDVVGDEGDCSLLQVAPPV
jgi:hypothetical protein